MLFTQWKPADPDDLSPEPVGPNTVAVWRVPLERAAAHLDRCRKVLTGEEREVAGRYHFPRHGDAFVLSRGYLRLVLGRYLGVAAADIRFRYGEHGKPALASPADSGLHFNLSHSGEVALIAVARAPVGVDVEGERAVRNLEDVARRFFTTGEAGVVAGVPARRRQEAFFRCWTRKEAVIKALGGSIADLSDAVDVLRSMRRLSRPVRLADPAWTQAQPEGPVSVEGPRTRALYLVDLPVPRGLQAACCLAEPIQLVRLYRFG